MFQKNHKKRKVPILLLDYDSQSGHPFLRRLMYTYYITSLSTQATSRQLLYSSESIIESIQAYQHPSNSSYQKYSAV